jgi:hypothetical protein
MKESQQPAYRLRLVRDYAYYDIGRSELWKSFRAGAIVTDEQEIQLLMAHGAPAEPIET